MVHQMRSKYSTVGGCTVFEHGWISSCVRVDIWHVEDECFLYFAYCMTQNNTTLVYLSLEVINHLQNIGIFSQVTFSFQIPMYIKKI